MPHKWLLRGKLLLTRPFTLLIVPPRGAQVKSARVPFWVVALGGFALSFLLTSVVITSFWYYRAQADRAELVKLRKVNVTQKEKLTSLQQEAQMVRAQLQEVMSLEQRIRAKAGLQSNRGLPDRSGEGRGGVARASGGSLFDSLFSPAEPVPDQIAQDLAEAAEEAKEALRTLERLEKDLDAHFKYLAALPDRWPVRGSVTSSFGSRPSPFGGGRSEFHNGIDVAAPWGAPIVAAGDGVVVFTGYRPGFGRTVVISHGYGYRSSYCHVSRYLVKTGAQVKKGEAIALVGSSGRSTGPHLHFMIEKDGSLMDPLQVLR
ncbi:MAG: M23 family metallopeptidase [Bacillota bacterium]|jgi:murein DD-endopeptidase MepM/ murein hydrolase activator NlpD|nr:M23 family metallopeptidase [Bacillota bacterium]